jgi:hypothetical protein
MGTGGNFDDEPTLLDRGGVRFVEAKGEADADLKEICVWVVQQQENGSDVAFTEMTTTMQNRDDFGQDPVGSPNRKWRLTVGKDRDSPAWRPRRGTSGNGDGNRAHGGRTRRRRAAQDAAVGAVGPVCRRFGSGLTIARQRRHKLDRSPNAGTRRRLKMG